MNEHAYVQMVMAGKNFFDSSNDAYYLVLRNASRFNLVGGLGGLFTLLGALIVPFL